MKISNWVVLIGLILGSCTNTNTINEEENNTNTPIKETVRSAGGIWILADYLDSIVVDKSIAKHRVKPLSWSALQVEITDSGMLCYGSIHQGGFTKGNINEGIVFNEPTTGNEYKYFYDGPNDIVRAVSTSDSTIRNYVRTEESFLYEDSGVFWKLEPKLHSYFVANAFAGTYVNLATNDSVVFDPKYNMSGLGEFTQYNVYMFMGTSHPFNDGDHITYYGKNNVRGMNYFEFEGDTLILYSYKEYPEYGGDSYVKDKEVIRLLKVE